MNILIYNILQAQLPTGIVILLGAKLPSMKKNNSRDTTNVPKLLSLNKVESSFKIMNSARFDSTV